MRKIFNLFFMVVILAALSLSLISCEFSFTTANLKNIKVASEINEETNAPVTVTDSFTTETSVVYVTCDLANAPEGTSIKAICYYIDNGSETVINEVEYESLHTNEALVVSFPKPENGWSIGKYEVRFYIDGVLKETATFNVQ